MKYKIIELPEDQWIPLISGKQDEYQDKYGLDTSDDKVTMYSDYTLEDPTHYIKGEEFKEYEVTQDQFERFTLKKFPEIKK